MATKKSTPKKVARTKPVATMREDDLRRHIAEPLKREFATAFRALRRTIMAIPEGEWRRADQKCNQPVRQVGHLLLGVERFLGGHHARVGKRFGVPVESLKAAFDAAACPPREQFLPWIDQVERIAEEHIDQAVAQSITGGPKQHPPLNRPTYFLRHAIVHLIILRQELKRRGIKRPGY